MPSAPGAMPHDHLGSLLHRRRRFGLTRLRGGCRTLSRADDNEAIYTGSATVVYVHFPEL